MPINEAVRSQIGLVPTHNPNQVSKDLATRGKQAEVSFENWLNREGFSYLPVCQEMQSFAPLFKGNLKRPDFLVLLESIGMIAVDVKSYTLTRDEYTLPYEAEFRRAMTFERMFRMPVWYAYWNMEGGFAHWLSALKAAEVGELRENKRDGKAFFSISLSHFHAIKTSADFGQLYTDRIKDLSNLSGRRGPVRESLYDLAGVRARTA